ncbi:MAG: MoxR family ATPase [Myxococcales bacterium]|nr:MoxR family ATPase [Myxococcales bacterium]MCB9642066.1 MoxR family ATPase [Myxococcales bacterium]
MQQFKDVNTEISKAYLGRTTLVEYLLASLIAQGHILLEGVPGVAKTTLVKAFAASLGIHFQRIQFTPDLLPADITGSYLYNMRDQAFDLRKGPLFANIVLADEINRAPAKTQSAMLEAMAEQQVTIEGERHPLPPPFMVLATQNPVEQEGVYPLPEAQLDRFLMKFQLGFPPRDVERAMLRTYRKTPNPPLAVLDAETILRWQHDVESVHVTEELEEYILDLVAYTRSHRSVLLGVSPRGTLGVLRASRAIAFVRGRDYVIPDDIRAMAIPVMAHRLIIQPEAEMEGLRGEQIIQEALQRIAVLRREMPSS